MTDPTPSELLGTWKLVSAVREEVPSGKRTDLYGPDPVGFLNYGADGRMITLIVRSDRDRPAGLPIGVDAAVRLFHGMMSYAGRYDISGDQVVHHVDASANEIWTGTEQRRTYRIDGDRLALATPVNEDPIDGKVSIRSMIWERWR